MTSSLRRRTRAIRVGNVTVGGDAPLTVQTMTKTDTRDAAATTAEIRRLALAGCDIIRLAIPDLAAAESLRRIIPEVSIPVIADIHFDHRLAIAAANAGAHGLRINPGNLRDRSHVREVLAAARDHGIPIRIGVNAGSLDPAMEKRFGGVTAEALAESALQEVRLLEDEGFTNLKIAIKAFDLALMIDAVRQVASRCDYPLHLGVTESGLPDEGIVRSSIGIGALLLEGIGDTIRVSLTGDSADEVAAGIRILRAVGLRQSGAVIVSCPTCGRCQVPLMRMAETVRQRLSHLTQPVRIAVMGCAVNGPGEARQADFGIAGGKDSGLIFKHGQILRHLPSDQLVEGLVQEISSSLGITIPPEPLPKRSDAKE